MCGTPVVLAIGVVDGRGVAGTGGVSAEWSELGVRGPGTGRTFRTLFGKTDATFRRLDTVSRAMVLAAEATGLQRVLRDTERNETALIFESRRGSLDTDRRLIREFAHGQVHAAGFPYTLPSTCLGEIALRHGLRGPTLCFSTGPERTGTALREVHAMLLHGEVRFALVGSFEVLQEDEAGTPACFSTVAAVVGMPHASLQAIGAWPTDVEDPYRALAAAAWRHGRAS